MNMHRQRTAIASRLTYLLSKPRLRYPIWPTVSTIKQQSTNKIIYPKIKDRKPIAAIGKDRVGGSYLCPATVMSRCNAQRCHTPELSASIGKRQQFFHWKTPGAGSEIANSLTVKGNFRVPATRRATNKMADASITDRNLPIMYRTFAMLYRLNEESPRSSAFYRTPPGGAEGGSRVFPIPRGRRV